MVAHNLDHRREEGACTCAGTGREEQGRQQNTDMTDDVCEEWSSYIVTRQHLRTLQMG